jgi:thioesterase domain-containing protein
MTAITRGPAPAKARHLVMSLSSGVGTVASVLLHPAGGGITPYLPIASHLARLGPVRAVRGRGLLPGEAADEDIATMADGYAVALSSEEPRPTLLFGWSMGGVLAWEVAARLAASGPVPLVVLVDSLADASIVAPAEMTSAGHYVVDYVRSVLGTVDANVCATIRAHVVATSRHRVQTKLATPALLLACGREPVRERLGDWFSLAPNLSVRRLPGGHFDVFSAGTLPTLLSHLDEFLAATCAEAGAS